MTTDANSLSFVIFVICQLRIRKQSKTMTKKKSRSIMKMLSVHFLMVKVQTIAVQNVVQNAVRKQDIWLVLQKKNLNQSPLYKLYNRQKKVGSLWCTRLTRSTEKLIPIIETDSKTPCLIHSRHSGSLIKVRKTNPFSWEPKQMTRSLNFLWMLLLRRFDVIFEVGTVVIR